VALGTYDCKPTLTDQQMMDFCRNGYLMLEGVVSDEVNRRTVEFAEPVHALDRRLGVIAHQCADNRVPRNPAGNPSGEAPSPVSVIVRAGVDRQRRLTLRGCGRSQREVGASHDASHRRPRALSALGPEVGDPRLLRRHRPSAWADYGNE